MTEAEKLLPCPFCGGEANANGSIKFDAKHEAWFSDGARVLEAFFCGCVTCGITNQGLFGHQTREKAIAAWNRRAAPSAEAVREACAKVCDAVWENEPRASQDFMFKQGFEAAAEICERYILALDLSQIAAPQLPHGVCHADDPNDQADQGAGSSASSLTRPDATTASPEARGVAPSVSDDRAGRSITAGAAPVLWGDTRQVMQNGPMFRFGVSTGAAPDGGAQEPVIAWIPIGSGTHPFVQKSDYDALTAKLAEAYASLSETTRIANEEMDRHKRDLDAALAAVRDVDGIVGNREIYRKWADKHAAIIAKAEER